MYIRAVNYRDTGRGPIVPLQKRLRGDTEEGWGTQADQRPTCLGSQANHKENPTNGNYTGRILTDGNYSWKAGLFLPSMIRSTERWGGG